MDMAEVKLESQEPPDLVDAQENANPTRLLDDDGKEEADKSAAPTPTPEDQLQQQEESRSVVGEKRVADAKESKDLPQSKPKKTKKKPWSAYDDLLLKESLEASHTFVEIMEKCKTKFTTPYTEEDLEQRWFSLLYDEKISRDAAMRMAQLVANKRVPWDEEEEAILLDEIKSDRFISFPALLQKYQNNFHWSRTAKSLEAHYYRMKRGGLVHTSLSDKRSQQKAAHFKQMQSTEKAKQGAATDGGALVGADGGDGDGRVEQNQDKTTVNDEP